jgi:hypothetical protein
MTGEQIANRLAMNECMNTHAITKSSIALSFVLASALACDPQGKQIGQLDAASDGESGSEGEGAELPASCTDAVDSLEAIFDATEGQRCALLVSFDYETFEPSGWNVTCDVGNLGMSEADAAALTTWGGKEISEPDDEDDDERSFIFYNEPGDVGLETVGGVGWVSNHAGRLFDASISSDGVGEIHYPLAFGEPSELGSGCVWLNSAYELRGYDLTRVDYVTDYQLPEGHVDALFDALMQTAVIRAADLTHGGKYYLDFLAYPRTVDDFDPSTADYMLVLEWWE